MLQYYISKATPGEFAFSSSLTFTTSTPDLEGDSSIDVDATLVFGVASLPILGDTSIALSHTLEFSVDSALVSNVTIGVLSLSLTFTTSAPDLDGIGAVDLSTSLSFSTSSTSAGFETYVLIGTGLIPMSYDFEFDTFVPVIAEGLLGSLSSSLVLFMQGGPSYLDLDGDGELQDLLPSLTLAMLNTPIIGTGGFDIAGTLVFDNEQSLVSDAAFALSGSLTFTTSTPDLIGDGALQTLEPTLAFSQSTALIGTGVTSLTTSIEFDAEILIGIIDVFAFSATLEFTQTIIVVDGTEREEVFVTLGTTMDPTRTLEVGVQV